MAIYVKLTDNVLVYKGNSIQYIYNGLDLDKVLNPLLLDDGSCLIEFDGNEDELTGNGNETVITEAEFIRVSEEEFDKKLAQNKSYEEVTEELKLENEQLKSRVEELDLAIFDMATKIIMSQGGGV